MPTNLNDPSLDFNIEEKILMQELLRAKELQQPKETLRQIGGNVVPWQPGQMIANSLNNSTGASRERSANEGLRGLSAEQQARLEALRGQLAPTTPVDMTDQNAMMAENARQGAIYGQMSNLPMGAEQAKQGLAQTSKLPQSMMTKAQGNNYDVANDTISNDRLTNAVALKRGQTVADDERNRGWDVEDRDLLAQNKLDLATQRGLNAGAGTTAAGAFTPAEKLDQEFLLKDNANDATTILRAIDTLETGGNFDAATGPVDDFMGSIPGYATGMAALGQPKMKAGISQIETVRGKVTEIAKQAMSKYGKLGNMAVQEWKIISDAVANLDPGAENFSQMLAEIKYRVRRADQFAREEYAKRSGVPVEEVNVMSLDDSLAQSIRDREKLTRKSDGDAKVVRTGTRNGIKIEQLSDGTIREVQ